MADIFGRTDQLMSGGLSADTMFMTWEGLTNDGLGLLVQNLAIQYNQPIRRIYELGPGVGAAPDTKQSTYWVVGRPQGRINFGRIFGFADISIEFYEKYGNPCFSSDLVLTATIGCQSAGLVLAGDTSWYVNGVLLENLAINVDANEMLVQEQIGGQFIGLQVG